MAFPASRGRRDDFIRSNELHSGEFPCAVVPPVVGAKPTVSPFGEHRRANCSCVGECAINEPEPVARSQVGKRGVLAGVVAGHLLLSSKRSGWLRRQVSGWSFARMELERWRDAGELLEGREETLRVETRVLLFFLTGELPRH